MFLLTSCSSKQDNEILGKMIGAAVGAVVGSKLGSGENSKAIYSILGAAGGYLLGKEIGRLLSQEEQDDLNDSIIYSLDQSKDGETTEWKSNENENTYAKITPDEEFREGDKNCRIYEKILYKDGKKIKKSSLACRDQDGNWSIS